jgi:Ca2+:H+ antiporter
MGSGSGSMSRSASRSRPPLSTQNTGLGGVPKVVVKDIKPKEEDDEDEVEDRGQALIRRRQKERKQLRRAKERERERRIVEDDDGFGPSPEPSAPPTAGLEDNPHHAMGHYSQVRSVGRSASTTRSRTASTDRRMGDVGYFSGHERVQSSQTGSVAGDETPRMEGRGSNSPREEVGMAGSMYSSYTEEEEEGVRDREDRASIVGDVVQEVIDEVEEDEEEQEDEEEDSAEGDDEGLTLKDRQDVSY